MEARETSGSTTALLLQYVQEQGGDAAVSEVIRRSGTSLGSEDLLDASRWVSHETRLRLFEAAADVLQDPRAPFHVGATANQRSLNHVQVLALRTLGSPQRVIEHVMRMGPRFTTVASTEVLELDNSSAVVRRHTHQGHRLSHVDCLYFQGLLAGIPRTFGLPPAEVVHTQCQVDGRSACVYAVRWSRQPPWHWGRRRRLAHHAELQALRGQLEALQLSASDLVDADGLETILDRIVERAAATVIAPSYLLVVEPPQGGPPLVSSHGLDAHRAAALAPRLLAGEDLQVGAFVVDIATPRRVHGRLAAVFPGEPVVLGTEQAALQAYARHAAAAIELLGALEHSRLGERRAKALLSLAHQLTTATDAMEVAEFVCDAIADIVGGQVNAVLFWEPAAGTLRTVACDGFTPAERDLLLTTGIRAEETPELVEVLTRRRPLELKAGGVSPGLERLFMAIGVQETVVVPMLAGDTLLGLVAAGHRAGQDADLVADVLERLQGVADQAATALGKAHLLSTVRHQSRYDSLTGLPNRMLFQDLLDDSLRTLGGDDGIAVLFCDLDRFKQVNDVLGHAAGDELLRQVAARLRGAVRPTDTVGRLSGDEFAVLLSGINDDSLAADLAQRIVRCFSEPFRLEGREQRVTTSVGVAVHTGPDGRGDRLLRAADAAMYEAKQRGRNQISIAGTVRQTNRAQLSMEAELAEAITGGQLRLHFQPMIATGSEAQSCPDDAQQGLRLVGAEALVRWEHPRLGLLGPAAFLPLAEESGLVADLDLWAVRTACEALAGWTSTHDVPLHVAVNLAAPTLLDPRLAATVRASLTANDIAPGQLHLEVVESRTLANLPGVIERLSELRQLGVRVSLDDFGTGYSTLAWLQQLPVDQIKIDRTFISALPDDPSSMAVVRGVLALARELGIEVVAEGVEDTRQLQALKDAGCDLLQGYLLGRPSPEHPELQMKAAPAA